MMKRVFSGRRGAAARFAGIALLACGMAWGADPPALPTLDATNGVSPAARMDTTQTQVAVTLTGTGFDDSLKLVFDPADAITNMDVKKSSGTMATATFIISKTATGYVKVYVTTTAGKSAKPFLFDTGVVCLESIGDQCTLRWEIETTAATGSSSQTNNTTTPNIVVKLDYQWRSPSSAAMRGAWLDAMSTTGDSDMASKAAQGALMRLSRKPSGTTADSKTPPTDGTTAQCKGKDNDVCKSQSNNRLDIHAIIKAGYTQVTTANKVTQAGSTGNSGSTTPSSTNSGGSSVSCPASTSSSSSGSTPTCMAATPQQAFIAELGTTLGWTFLQDGHGIFGEFGFGARGQFQDLISASQIVTNGGVSYVDLNTQNLRSVAGLYEGVGRFKLSSWNHDSQPISQGSGTGNYPNVSDLFVFEAGYQYNTGLQQLVATNPTIDTRKRFVGRFYLYPEIPSNSTSHTKGAIGVEYSAGIGGGPKVIQLFWGLNLNAAKLFQQ